MSTTSAITIHDRLYGTIEFDDSILKLFQTKEMARLRKVSLSAIPTWILPVGVCASKFEHSMGVAHLAQIITRNIDVPHAPEVIVASLAHDIATPPFSHASEHFLIELLNKNHEQYVEVILSDSEFNQVAGEQGIDLSLVVKLINGEAKPLGDLVNGSIDVDNLDNSLRFGLSMGIIHKSLYSPEKLAEAFINCDDGFGINAEYTFDLIGWEQTRKEVYNFVYSQDNLATGTMLMRAMEFAFEAGEMQEEFFRMTDEEAFLYLAKNCNDKTQTLIDRIDRWQRYQLVFDWKESEVGKPMAKYVKTFSNRKQLADRIAREFKLPPEDVAVHFSLNKGFKQVHLPIIGEDYSYTHVPLQRQSYMIQVYIHPKHDVAKQIRELVSEQIAHLS